MTRTTRNARKHRALNATQLQMLARLQARVDALYDELAAELARWTPGAWSENQEARLNEKCLAAAWAEEEARTARTPNERRGLWDLAADYRAERRIVDRLDFALTEAERRYGWNGRR